MEMDILLSHFFEPEDKLDDIDEGVGSIGISPGSKDVVKAKLIAGKGMVVLAFGMAEAFLDVILDIRDRHHLSGLLVDKTHGY